MNNVHSESAKLLSQADALLAAGQYAEAIPRYQQLLALDARHANAWFNLGYALRQQGAFDAALQAYAQALLHGVRDPKQVHLNRAVLLSDHLRRDDEAEAELVQALHIAPGYAPALLNLGNLHEERGRRDEAIACYQRLLDLPTAQADGLDHEALARLVLLQPPAGPAAPLLLRLQAQAGRREPMGDTQRSALYFSLGRCLDSLGQHERAFAAFAQGKHWAHRAAPAYDPRATTQRNEALMAAFAGGPLAASAPVLWQPEPVFICGMFRSGSTLAEQLLAAHPAVCAGGELDLLPRMVATTLKPFPQSLRQWDAARCAQLAGQYHSALLRRLGPVASLPSTRYVSDKRPDNYAFIGLIKQLFPRAKIIHTVRHPLDNGLSVYMQHLNPSTFAYAGRLEDIGHHFGEYRRLMAHWRRLYPGDIHDFDYDAFVAAPEPALRGLLEFLGLPWDAACLDFHTLGNTVKTASYWQVRKPVYADASGRWQRYRAWLAPLRQSLAQAGIVLDEAGQSGSAR